MYELNSEERIRAYKEAKRRAEQGSFSHRSTFVAASKRIHLRFEYMAAMGELGTAIVLDKSWTGEGTGPGVLDVGDCIDVRTVESGCRGLLARPNNDDEIPCVLVWVKSMKNGRLGICDFRGWAYYREVKQGGRLLKGEDGRWGDCWILPPDKLKPIEELLEVIKHDRRDKADDLLTESAGSREV